MSELLYFSEHTLQEAALLIMAGVYTARIIWLLRFKAGRERQAPSNPVRTNRRKGIVYSWMNIAMPWAMESTRTRAFMYIQFVVFHLGVVAAITLSFVIPYAPDLLRLPGVVPAFQAGIGAACLVGLMRIYRRLSDKIMRAISSPDDYFSLALLTVWFFFAALAAPNRLDRGETVLLIYFIMTAFFLVYVPFSKISHYLYYPFTRYYLGRTMGHRGVFPIVRAPQPKAAGGRALGTAATWGTLAANGSSGDGSQQ